MRIGIVTSNYPYPARPYCGAFVQELVWELARQGHVCTVIAPVAWWDRARFGPLGERDELERVARSQATVRVLRPRIVTTSSGTWAGVNLAEVSDLLFANAVRRELQALGNELDLVYAHFFYPSGWAAARWAGSSGAAYFVAHGDDDIATWYLSKGREHFQGVRGVIAVSQRNAAFCKEVFAIDAEKVSVFPNGVDRTHFFPRDREEARRTLGFPDEMRVAAFVGHFIERKGPDRVVAAIEQLDETYAMLMGEGPIMPESDRVVFRGVVSRNRLPWFLSAADVFVLPTTGEGSCNAILEAMACGLPIVSASGAYNDDILNDDVSIRVNPMDVREIRDAIATLFKSPERRLRMAEKSLEWSRRFSIEARARGIVQWIEGRLERGTVKEQRDLG